jgi:hypothetical protein
MSTRRRLRPVVLLGIGALIWAASVTAAPRPRAIELSIVGFSLRPTTSPRNLAAPNGTLRSSTCRPRQLVAYTSFSRIRRGALVRWRWTYQGRLVTSYDETWNHSARRRVVTDAIRNPRSLPRGTYRLTVRVPGGDRATATVRLACRR